MLRIFAFQKRLSRYWRTSLEDYYFFAGYRNLGYLLFTILTGLFTITLLKFHEMQSSFSGSSITVMGLYAWVTALNFGFCLYIMDEWISRLWKEWGDFENRTVGKVWGIWFVAFISAFVIQKVLINQVFELYDLKMRWLYYVYPKESPSYLLGFMYSFPFWFIGVFSIIQIALRKQFALKGEKSNLPDLIHQKEWIFNQRLDQLKTPSISKAAGANKIKASSELLIPDKDTFERIHIDQISHINVEDHYCRIFVKEQEVVKEFFVQIALKEILDQLPPGFFLQIHRSHIVNLSFVSSLIKDSRSYQLALNQGAHTLPISRHRLPQVLSILEKYIG